MQHKICTQCQASFEIDEWDIKFLDTVSPVFSDKKYQIPLPNKCPTCREQQRMAFRNERKMYKRKCDATGEEILSRFSPDKPFPVYQPSYWWSDAWDARSYGRDFDFSRGFFEQFQELQSAVPIASRGVQESTMVNSDYCNLCVDMKNCYMVFEAYRDEKCMYSRGLYYCYGCVDCLDVHRSESCYQCVNSHDCSFSKYLQDSKGCDDCAFGLNLIGCKHCFACVNLRNKSYCFFNQEFSKEEYEKKVVEYMNGKSDKNILEEFLKFRLQFPVLYSRQINVENCSGDNITNSKNCQECFYCHQSQDCRYCNDLIEGNDGNFMCMDIHLGGAGVSHCYQLHATALNVHNLLFCDDVWNNVHNILYSRHCVNGSHNLFGCISIQKGSYCILNKQYVKDDYEKMVGRIIEHMMETGEWGAFFPIGMSTFCYNESFAQDFFPFTKEEVLKRGGHWYEDVSEVFSEVPQGALLCSGCQKPFKILSSEKEFYEKWELEHPEKCFECRHQERLRFSSPRRLWERICAKCNKQIKTSYAPGRPEVVYCEQCYLQEIY